MQSPEYVGSGDPATASGGVLAAPVPVGVQSGDLLIVWGYSSDISYDFDAPAGWTYQEGPIRFPNSFSSLETANLWWRLSPETPPATYDWTTNAPNGFGAVRMVAYRGIDVTAPIEEVQSVSAPAVAPYGSVMTWDSMTSDGTKRTAVYFGVGVANGSDSEPTSFSSGLTQRPSGETDGVDTGGFRMLSWDEQHHNAGAIGTRQVTFTGEPPYFGFSLLLRPAEVIVTPRATGGVRSTQCPDYVVQIARRGGSPVLTELPWSAFSYGRMLDEMSSASVTVPVGAIDEECCAVLTDLRAWEHEIVIWQDGASDPDWVGPLIEPAWTRDAVTMQARDLFQHFERRRIGLFDYDPIIDDPVTIFEAFALDALSGDLTPNITLVVQSLAGFDAERIVLVSEHRIAADELRELSRTAVDWTMRGRELLISGDSLNVPFVGIVDNEDIDNPTLTQRGAESASLVVVKGSPGSSGTSATFGADTKQVVTVVGGVEPNIGLVERVFSDLTVREGQSTDQAAASRLALLNPPPHVLTFDLNQRSTIPRTSLVPGALIDPRVKLACREFSSMMRLAGVNVSVSASDTGPAESVTLTCEPVG